MRHAIKPRQSTDLMESFKNEMDRLFEDMFGTTDLPLLQEQFSEQMFKPVIEMSEKEGNYVIKAQLPGVDKNDIDIEVGEDSISIKAETHKKEEEKTEETFRSEFRYGKFFRAIPFPSQVDSSNAKADYKDGVLKITVPKSEEEKKRLKKLNID